MDRDDPLGLRSKSIRCPHCSEGWEEDKYEEHLKSHALPEVKKPITQEFESVIGYKSCPWCKQVYKCAKEEKSRGEHICLALEDNIIFYDWECEFWRVIHKGDVEEVKTEREDYDLTQIPFSALQRLGKVFVEGASKYGEGNWRNGVAQSEFQIERANHALKHLLIHIHKLRYGESIGEEGEDDLAKVMWYCVTQAELERLEKESA